MTKRKVVILLLLTFTLLIGGGIISIIQSYDREVKSFELNEYQYCLETFSSEENVGTIINAKDAVEKAEKIWVSIYGESIKRERPYQVYYDKQNDAWLIHGTFKSVFGNAKGGVANIIIENSSGQVLAVWHEK